MRKLLATLVAAIFAAVTFVAYGADQPASGEQAQPQKPAKQSKKKQKHAKKKQSQGVEAGGETTSAGRGSTAPSAGKGAVEQGGTQPGRGTPTGTAAPGGAVTTTPQTAPGRSSQ